MLIVETTPNLYGIKLQGDYQDLNALYDSLSRYLEFFENNNEYLPYHEYEFLLSLNYDIRHAYMGAREVAIKENNAESVGSLAEVIYKIPAEGKKEISDIREKFKYGNLYFSVEILYPLVFHYLVALEDITYDEPDVEWFENPPEFVPDYSIVDANYDRAQIRAFTALLWKNMVSVFGDERAEMALDYLENKEYLPASYVYTEGLLHWQLANSAKLSEQEKKDFLLVCLYEIMDSEELIEAKEDFIGAYENFRDAKESIERAAVAEFPWKDEFYRRLDEFLEDGKSFTEDAFDVFLEERYGKVENEEPEF